MINKKIETHVYELLSTLGIKDEIPVPIEKIAKSKSVEIKPYDLGENISGILVIDAGQGVIGFNPHDPKVRQRFTIAHELGHFELHKDKKELFIDKGFKVLFRDENSSKGDIKNEKEANAFAAALLMPEKNLREEIINRELDLTDEDSMKTLAKIFDVSIPAMTFRVANLNLIWKL